MSNDIRRIERDLEKDRDDLARNLEALKSSLTFSGLMGQGARLVEDGKQKASEGLSQGVQGLSQSVQGVSQGVSSGIEAATALVKDNPVAAAAAGAGLSWIVKKVTEPGRGDPAAAGDQRLADLFSPSSSAPTEDEFWIAEADRLRERAADLLEMLDEAEERGLLPIDQILARRQEVRSSLTQDTRRVMMRGLEGLSGSARDKAFRKREELYARHLGHDTGRGIVKPVAIGALVAGTGLALAWLLPRSATEAKVVGEMRDKLVAEVGGFMKKNPAIGSMITSKLLGAAVSMALRRR